MPADWSPIEMAGFVEAVGEAVKGRTRWKSSWSVRIALWRPATVLSVAERLSRVDAPRAAKTGIRYHFSVETVDGQFLPLGRSAVDPELALLTAESTLRRGAQKYRIEAMEHRPSRCKSRQRGTKRQCRLHQGHSGRHTYGKKKEGKKASRGHSRH